MSVVFGHSIRVYKNSTTYKIPLFTSKSDISAQNYLCVYKEQTYYSPLQPEGTSEYSNVLKAYKGKILSSHNNKIRVDVYYTRNTYSPTSGVYLYYFTVTKITCDAPLPCAWTLYFKHGNSTYTVSMPANAKTKSGTLIKTSPLSTTSATWYPYWSYSGKSGTGNSYQVSSSGSDWSWLPLENFN